MQKQRERRTRREERRNFSFPVGCLGQWIAARLLLLLRLLQHAGLAGHVQGISDSGLPFEEGILPASCAPVKCFSSLASLQPITRRQPSLPLALPLFPCPFFRPYRYIANFCLSHLFSYLPFRASHLSLAVGLFIVKAFICLLRISHLQLYLVCFELFKWFSKWPVINLYSFRGQWTRSCLFFVISFWL